MTPGFLDDGTGDGLTLNCPCGDSYVHMAEVDVDRGGSVATITNAVEIGLSRRDPSARGAFLDVRCNCESGCQFTLHIQFHKGNTTLEIRDWRQVDHEPEKGWRGDLWRD